MRFSIVIPAYNADGSIFRTVQSAVAQRLTIPQEEFEVIVADNNSQDDTADQARKAGADKVVKEMAKGTNFARNRGYLESKGEIVAFLDADSQAPSDWLLRIGRIFEDPRVQAVSGPYDYGFTWLKALADVFYTRVIFPLMLAILGLFKGTAIMIGGNFAVRRSALEKIGGIPLVKFWGDDVLIATLVQRMVGKVKFTPGLNVRSAHDRFDRDGFLTLAAKYATAFFEVWWRVPKHPRKENIPKIIAKVFKTPLTD